MELGRFETSSIPARNSGFPEPTSAFPAGNPSSPILVGVGDLVVSDAARPLVTVVGSCLALVVSAPAWGVSGIMHAIYPSRSRRLPEAGKVSRLFVDEAMEELLYQFTALGIRREQLVLRLYGGACITLSAQARLVMQSPGDANLEVARRFLREVGLVPETTDVGGSCGRRITLVPSIGAVTCTTLQSALTAPADDGVRASTTGGLP